MEMLATAVPLARDTHYLTGYDVIGAVVTSACDPYAGGGSNPLAKIVSSK